MKLTLSILSSGLLAMATAQAVYEPARLPDPSRRWAVTLGVRGEYDDNIHTTSSNRVGSYKAIIDPQLLVNIPTDQTFIGMRYSYRAAYYDNRSGDAIDQAHTADLIVSHTVNPRLLLDVRDRLRRGIEPELVENEVGRQVTLRRRGDFLFNSVSGSASYDISPRWTTSVEGGWDHWDYDTAAASIDDRNLYNSGLTAVYDLDRRTQTGVGYQYGHVAYDQPGANDLRNSDSHIGYISLVRRFNPQLSLQANAGAEFREFGDGSTDFGPWLDASASYNYGPRSTASAGVRYSISTTEVNLFRSSDSADIFGQVTHRVTTKLTVSGNASYSLDSFSNPAIALPPGVSISSEEQTLSLGLSLRYKFTRWLSGDAGYNFDRVDSDVAGRGFTRNRIFLGCRLEY